MLAIFTCAILIIWGLNNPDNFGAEWYILCIIGEAGIISASYAFNCDSSKPVRHLSYISIIVHLFGMMAFCYDIDSIYNAYGYIVQLLEVSQILFLGLIPLIIRTMLWTQLRS